MIRHRTARKIASQWHGGQSSGLYALSSSGAILGDDHIETYDNPCQRELLANVKHVQFESGYTKKDLRDLHNLLDYIARYGPRSTVDGWSQMPWEDA